MGKNRFSSGKTKKTEKITTIALLTAAFIFLTVILSGSQAPSSNIEITIYGVCYKITLKDDGGNPIFATRDELKVTVNSQLCKIYPAPPATDPAVETENNKARNEKRDHDLRYDVWTAVPPAGSPSGSVTVTVTKDGKEYTTTKTPFRKAVAALASSETAGYYGPPSGYYATGVADLSISPQVVARGETITARIQFKSSYWARGAWCGCSYADPNGIRLDGVLVPRSQVYNGSGQAVGDRWYNWQIQPEPDSPAYMVWVSDDTGWGAHTVEFKLDPAYSDKKFTLDMTAYWGFGAWRGPCVCVGKSIANTAWDAVEGFNIAVELPEEDDPGGDGGDILDCGECETGSCLVLRSGNNLLSKTDLSYNSIGPSLSFTRSYSSRWSYDGPLGYGWTHNYNISVKELSDGSVEETSENGKIYTYSPGSGNAYESPPGKNSVLVKNPDNTFLLTEKEQTTKHFDAEGKLLSISDQNGNTMSFSYDTNKRLVKITDPGGRETNLLYNADDKIVSISDPAQRTVRFSYDTDNNLITVQDVSSLETSYSYDAAHNLTTINSYDSKTHTFSYNSDDKLVSRSDPEQSTRDYTYNEATKTIAVKDARGNITTYVLDDKGRAISMKDPAGAETKYEWDDNNNITKTTDPRGGIQEFTFDGRGNMLTSKDQLGNVTTYTYTDKNEVSSVKDALGNTRSFIYDSKGNLLKEADTDGNTVVSHTYDNNGNTTSMKDALGHTYRYSFDPYGNLIEEKDPLGRKTTHTYSIIDWRTGTSDAKGRVTGFEYNTRGDLIEERYPDGTSTKYEYHGCCGILDSVVDANLNKVEYFYDDSRRLVRVRDASDGETSYEYDENGNRVAIVDPRGNRVSFSYNERNQLIGITYPDGTSESLSYNLDGSLQSKTDGNGNITRFEYDAIGRMVSKTYPDGSKVEYAFDAVGNRLTMTDRTGVTAYTYDNLYRPTRITLSSGKNISYTHDIAGNRVSMTDYEGKSYGYKYNELNQLKSFELPNRQKVDYKYDTLNAISKISYPNSTYINYTYNNMNRVEKITNMKKKTFNDKLISEFAYSYDPVGNRLKMVERGSFQHSKDTFQHSKDTSYSYDPLYRLEKVVYPNETTESYDYDASSNRVKRETVKRYFCSIFAAWKWDSKGAKSFIHYLFHPKYVTYITEYSYDSANKLLETVDKKESDSKTKLLKTTTLDYDRNGNQVKESVLHRGSDKPMESTYDYDYDNRLTEALMKGTRLYQFGYDAEGRRISTTVSNVRRGKEDYKCGPKPDVVYHLYDGSNLIMDLDSKGKVVSKFSYGLGLTSIDSKNLNGYYMADALGSITEITGKHGNVLRDYRYSAFGDQISGGEGYGDSNPFRYIGSYGVRWQDETFGHYHMGARYYQPNTGRFTQRDPLGTNSASNRFVYVDNNPINSIDPSGLIRMGTSVDPDYTKKANMARTNLYRDFCTAKSDRVKYCESAVPQKPKIDYCALMLAQDITMDIKTVSQPDKMGETTSGNSFFITQNNFKKKDPIRCIGATIIHELTHVGMHRLDPTYSGSHNCGLFEFYNCVYWDYPAILEY